MWRPCVAVVVVVVVAEKRSPGRAHIPGGGSGGSRGPRSSRGGRVVKADREEVAHVGGAVVFTGACRALGGRAC